MPKYYHLIFVIIFAFVLQTSAQTIYYVKQNGGNDLNAGTSWNNAFATVTQALSAANSSSNSEIWVAKGFYTPTNGISRDSSFRILKGGIKLLGGFVGTESSSSQRNANLNVTTLSGDIGLLNNSGDNSYHTLTVFNLNGSGVIDSTTVIDGFFFTGSSAGTISTFTYKAGWVLNRFTGGAIYIKSDSAFRNAAPLIRNCNFIGNGAVTSGGAIFVQGTFSKNSIMLIDNCKFTSNRTSTSGGTISNVFVGHNFNFIIRNSTIQGSSAISGGCIYNNISPQNTLTIENSVFENNTGSMEGGCILAFDNTTVQIKSSIFLNNESNQGGVINFDGSSANNFCTVNNSLFVSNIADSEGGTFYFNNVNSTVSGCTFFGGKCDMFTQSSVIRTNLNTAFYNSIFWKNGQDYHGGLALFDGPVTNNSCLGQGLTANNGNLPGIDPMFSDTLNIKGPDGNYFTQDDGFNLKSCSPAIDKGNYQIFPSDLVNDITGGARNKFYGSDIGAYESLKLAGTITSIAQSIPGACLGQSAVLTFTGLLESDSKWYLYKDDCNSNTPIDSTSSFLFLVKPSISTTYILKLSGTSGCQRNDICWSSTIGTFPLPIVTITGSGIVCPNSTTMLTALGASLYTWTGGPISQFNTITPIDPTVYTVTGKDLNGCVNTSVHNVNTYVNTQIVSQPDSKTICGANLTLFNVSAIGTNLGYTWSSGATTSSIFTSIPGIYVVTIAGKCGVLISDEFSLLSNPLTKIVLQPVSNSVCNGNLSLFNVSAIGANLAYMWNNGVNESSMSTSIAGVYVVTVVSACGNVVSNSAALEINTAPEIVSQPTLVTICGNDLASIIVSATGSNLNFIWSNGENVPNIITSLPGDYNLTITGTCGRIISDTIVLTAYKKTSIISQPPLVTTITSDVSFTLSVAADGEDLHYLWSNGSISSTMTTTVTGAYHVKVDGKCGSIITPDFRVVSIITSTVTFPGTTLTLSGTWGILSWPEIPNAQSYCIEVYKDSLLSKLISSVCDLEMTSHKFDINDPGLKLEATGVYFYRIKGVNVLGDGNWSNLQRIEFYDEVNSINQISSDNNIVLYPNPASDYIMLLSPESLKGNVKIENIIGDILFKNNVLGDGNKIDISSLYPGAYFLKFGNTTLKFFKE